MTCSPGFCVATFLPPFTLLHLRGPRDLSDSGASTVWGGGGAEYTRIRLCDRVHARTLACLLVCIEKYNWRCCGCIHEYHILCESALKSHVPITPSMLCY